MIWFTNLLKKRQRHNQPPFLKSSRAVLSPWTSPIMVSAVLPTPMVIIMPQECTCSTDRSGTRLPWMYSLVLSSGIFQPPYQTLLPNCLGTRSAKMLTLLFLNSSFLPSSLLTFFSRFHPSDLFLQCSLRMS